MMDKRCGTCEFFTPDVNSDDKSFGWCMRYPPKVTARYDEKNERWETFSANPRVYEDLPPCKEWMIK